MTQWRNIRLIYTREIRDQLRDRRTLFMIAVLPLLLYPLLGMSVFQLSQFLRTTEPRIAVVGSEQLADSPGLPPLFDGAHFSDALFDDPAAARQILLEFVTEESDDSGIAPDPAAAGDPPAAAQALSPPVEQRLKSGEIQLVLLFPPDFGARLRELHAQMESVAAGQPAAEAAPTRVDVPQPVLLFNSARERSRVAHAQVERVLNSWKSQLVRSNLLASRVPLNVARPFELQPRDVAEHRQQQALMWSKILPFVLFIWALTGAFYPAVDLCAGEKERGTLETLLSSPALRTEIVWGKLLTVMTFSIATALLNLASLGLTAKYVVSQLQSLPGAGLIEGLELPSLAASLWLLVALVPMSAMFSALCLACAAFARSTKEGQYYLMPLLLVMMPLMMLPMAPGAELDLGNSLIPVTGVVLLLKGLVQGNYAEVLPYVVPVSLVTLGCCHLAVRWAVYQFNQESVLFRESERLDLRRWVVHLVRDRQDTPSLAEAFFCVGLIYVIQFFTRLAISSNSPAAPDFGYFALLIFISQVVCIAVPALLLTLFLTGRPWKTLLLDRTPRWSACVAALLLAVAWQPIGQQFVLWINQVYPLSQAVVEYSQRFAEMLEMAPYVWLPLVLLALLPAVCEELAFRGFILSGLRHVGNKWWAIGLSAVFFGVAHSVIQQSIAATAVGLVLGYLAVQTGSLLPCILFHAAYNGLMLSTTHLPALVERWPNLRTFLDEIAPGQYVYAWPVVAASALMAAGLLMWFHRLRYQATREERLSNVRSRQADHPLANAPGRAE